MKLVKHASAGFAYFCVASVLAQAVFVSVLWAKGWLSAERRTRMMTVLYDIDLPDASTAGGGGTESGSGNSAALIQSRVEASPALANRRIAVGKTLETIDALLRSLETIHSENARSRDQLAATLDDLESQIVESSLLEVQTTLAALKPKQAKDQIMRMLDDEAWEDVIAIVEAMPLDKRKKILAEFKSEDEAASLHDIIERIRLSEQQARAGPTVSSR